MLLTSLLLAAPLLSGPSSSLKFVANEPRRYEFADQRSLPPTFGAGEFTLGLWIKPDPSFGVGETDRGTIDQLTKWSAYDPRPYSEPGWWYSGNWLLDGHSRPNGFDGGDSRAGTFSLQLFGGGRVRWTFADDDRVVPVGMVWAVQPRPARSAPSLLDGKWHHVSCVRRWTGESQAQLELWVDGSLVGKETIPQRVNMRRYWDSPPHPNNPKNLGGWCWGSEVMTAWNFYFTQYEDYKGLLDDVAFWDRARTPQELTSDWQKPLTGKEPGLVGWFAFDEGNGAVTRDRLDPRRTISLREVPWTAENAPQG
jgi:hypothetical protein